MGFTTGLLGGLTLTYSVLYITLYLHKANRNVQHTLLSQQSILLNSIVEPLPPVREPPVYQVRRDDMVETMKDRWNSEVEGLVRRVENTNWDEVRERWERRVGNVWAKMRQSETGQELETRLKENVIGTAEQPQNTIETGSSNTDGNRLLEVK